MNTVVYVDRELAIAMAVKLVGLELRKDQTQTSGGAFNWLIQAHVSQEETTGITTDIRELLPEEIIYAVHSEIAPDYKFSAVEQCVDRMAMSGDDRLLPGAPISVNGTLQFPNHDTAEYDPFNPPNIEVPTFVFHGEKCFTGELVGDGFRLPIYFNDKAKAQVVFCHDNPVEVTGIVRWSPPYSPKGAKSLSLLLRVAALWLR